MQTFRTTLKSQRAPFTLRYTDRILSMGSCFAVHIGERLRQYKFPIENNPFGILYNPVSMLRSLQRLRDGRLYEPADLFEHHGLWHSFDHHGAFSRERPEPALQAMNGALEQGAQQLARSQRLILTFGAAFVFEHIGQRCIVANCHKVPASQFRRYRLDKEKIVADWLPFLQELKEEKPDLRVIASVSPVRHLRDGLVENQRSKATLLLALDELCRRLDFVHYFPAYELLLDDLRDYRFFDRDLSHPNALAIDYIWDFFQDTYFDASTQGIMDQVIKILASRAHRPLHPGSDAHRQFVKQQLEKIDNLQRAYPFLDFAEEIEYFENGL